MNRTTRGRGLAAASAVLALAGSLLGAGAVAEPATAADPSTLGFHCTFPLLGSQPLKVKISTSLPATIPAGQQTEPIKVDAVATIDAETTPGLVAVGTAKLEGVASAKARIEVPGGTALNLDVPAKLEPTPVPRSGAFDIVASASIAPISFPQEGTAKVTLDTMVLSISPKLADGRLTGLDTFDADCTLDPGQSNVISTVVVTAGGPTTPPPPPHALDYTLKGASVLKAAQANVPLSGGVQAKIEGSAVSADLTLDPTSTSFNAFGFLPVTARVVFAPVGKTTGSIGSAGLTTRSSLNVSLPTITSFGFPVGGGATCRTTTPAVVPLAASTFDPMKGGTLTGTYTLPSFASCGMFTTFVNSAASGPGNTIRVALTPKI